METSAESRTAPPSEPRCRHRQPDRDAGASESQDANTAGLVGLQVSDACRPGPTTRNWGCLRRT